VSKIGVFSGYIGEGWNIHGAVSVLPDLDILRCVITSGVLRRADASKIENEVTNYYV